jgi:DNA-binding response OmpR family regulator
MTQSHRSELHIVVADRRPKSYQNLTHLAGDYGWHVHFLTTGAAAIQFARPRCADLWMINVRLPDMSGFELLEILRERAVGVPVFIIADHPNADDENRACCGGASLYLCKDTAQSIDCKPLLERFTDHRDVHARSPCSVS